MYTLPTHSVELSYNLFFLVAVGGDDRVRDIGSATKNGSTVTTSQN